MAWVIRPTFKWREPNAIRRLREEHRRRRQPGYIALLTLLVGTAAMMGIWALLHLLPPPRHPWSPVGRAIVASLAFGLLAAYGLPLLLRLCPCYVYVCDSRLRMLIGNQISELPYADIADAAIADIGEHTVLMVTGKNGDELCIGLAAGIDAQSVQAYIATRLPR